MSERLRVCGSANGYGGELWDGSFPAIVATFLRRENPEECNELWLESENVYTVWHDNKELARMKTTKGHKDAYKSLLKKIKKELAVNG